MIYYLFKFFISKNNTLLVAIYVNYIFICPKGIVRSLNNWNIIQTHYLSIYIPYSAPVAPYTTRHLQSILTI